MGFGVNSCYNLATGLSCEAAVCSKQVAFVDAVFVQMSNFAAGSFILCYVQWLCSYCLHAVPHSCLERILHIGAAAAAACVGGGVCVYRSAWIRSGVVIVCR